MSLKSFIYDAYNKLRVQFLESVQPKAVQHPPNVPLPTVKRSKGGRRPVAFDEAKAMALRHQGWSDRRIARQMHVAVATVGARLRNWKPVPLPPLPPPAPVQQAPLGIQEPPVMSATVPPPAPAFVAPVPPPEPCGSVPEGTKAFLLVHGQLNQEFAKNCGQHALGIESWHYEYAFLPAFQDAERIRVVITREEDNRRFLLSLAGDIAIRERCVISTDGVQDVVKSKRALELTRRYEHQTFNRQLFETLHKFQAIPPMNHGAKLNALLAPPPTESEDKIVSFAGSWGNDWWRHGGNGTGAR
jgi:hypothetical protein